MKNKIRLTSAIAAAALLSHAPAHAQFFGIFQGVVSAANQVTGKLGNKMLGGEKPANLEEERAKFYASIDTNTRGMDETTRRTVMGGIDSKWAMAESAFLMSNAQAFRARTAPLVDFKKVALDALGGAGMAVNMGSVFGGAGLTGVLQSAAMDGIITGAGGRPSGFNPVAARAGAAHMGTMAAGANPAAAAVSAGIAAPIAGAVSSAVSGVVAGGMQGGAAATPSALGPDYELAETSDPVVFFGRHPAEWQAKDLYRENGNLGWKRIEAAADGTVEAYAPVAGDDHAKAAVFNIDPASGRINAAFRVLTVDNGDFLRVVAGVSERLQAQPRFASQGQVMRAVWENGVFVAADGSKVSSGWSWLVPAMYRSVSPTVASR